MVYDVQPRVKRIVQHPEFVSFNDIGRTCLHECFKVVVLTDRRTSKAIPMVFLVTYLIGLPVAYGFRGGVKDGVDGIADEWFIVLWPLMFFVVPIKQLVKLGNYIRRRV